MTDEALARQGEWVGRAFAAGLAEGLRSARPGVAEAARDLAECLLRYESRFVTPSEREWYAKLRAYRFSRPRGHWEDND